MKQLTIKGFEKPEKLKRLNINDRANIIYLNIDKLPETKKALGL